MIRPRRLAFASVATLALMAPALAQSGDTLVRLNQLESQVRELNGRIEELNFFILQMQEELRRQKEDNEFRFQDLEGQRQGAAPRQDDGTDGTDGTDTASTPPADDTTPAIGSTAELGAPPRDLGTLPAGTGLSALDLSPEMANDAALVAAIEGADDDAALLAVAQDFALAGEHARAAEVLDVHLRRYPDAATAPDATLALGRSLLAEGRAEEAAEVMLDGHDRFGEAPAAPDLLVGVGRSMAELGNRDIACATFDEVDRLYPLAGSQIAQGVRQARADAQC